MKIQLNEKFVLNSDAYSVWITELVSKKNGGGVYERVYNGYHANIQDCLLSFVKRRVNVSDVSTLVELAEDISHIEGIIRAFCASIQADIRERGPRK